MATGAGEGDEEAVAGGLEQPAAVLGGDRLYEVSTQRAHARQGVRAVLRGIRRTLGAAREGKAPATADILTTMLALCSATLVGHRDRALLALGFAGAFRRSELVALEVGDLSESRTGFGSGSAAARPTRKGTGLRSPFSPARSRPNFGS
jgi:hypothetical protein